MNFTITGWLKIITGIIRFIPMTIFTACVIEKAVYVNCTFTSVA